MIRTRLSLLLYTPRWIHSSIFSKSSRHLSHPSLCIVNNSFTKRPGQNIHYRRMRLHLFVKHCVYFLSLSFYLRVCMSDECLCRHLHPRPCVDWRQSLPPTLLETAISLARQPLEVLLSTPPASTGEQHWDCNTLPGLLSLSSRGNKHLTHWATSPPHSLTSQHCICIHTRLE